MNYLRTSDLARAVGVHPNTVRRYVDRGYLPPVERSRTGYRHFTRRHLDYLRLASHVYCCQYPGKAIHLSGRRIVQAAVSGDLGGALELAHRHLALVRAERAQADAAADLLERWASGAPSGAGACGPLRGGSPCGNRVPAFSLGCASLAGCHRVPAFSASPRAPASAPAETTMQPLQIGQAALVLGVTIDMLRNWDRNGLIAIPRDPANGYRRYGEPEISRLRVIRMLSRSGYSLSAILRMLIQLDQGEKTDLRRALDTPRPDEDVYLASDRWLSTLTDQEERAHVMIALIEEIIQKQPPGNC